MKNFLPFTPKNISRAILIAIFPWLPPYLFEKTDFYFHLTHQPDWYYNLSGNRLLVDLASFAVWGIVLAYLLRPRWAIIQIGLNALLVWVLLYLACPVYGPGGLWQPECYYPGPDGLVGLRLAGIMFCYGALPVLVKAAEKRDALNRRIRPALAILSGIILSVVVIWFPLSAWFSGVTYLPLLLIFQTLLLVGVSQIATGILAARIGRSLKIGAVSLCSIMGSLCVGGQCHGTGLTVKVMVAQGIGSAGHNQDRRCPTSRTCSCLDHLFMDARS